MFRALKSEPMSPCMKMMTRSGFVGPNHNPFKMNFFGVVISTT